VNGIYKAQMILEEQHVMWSWPKKSNLDDQIMILKIMIWSWRSRHAHSSSLDAPALKFEIYRHTNRTTMLNSI